MIVFKKADLLSSHLAQLSVNSARIGFIPTMGALHEGHIALMREAQQQTDVTVCSIFVNPTQFNNSTDFAKYPITIDADVSKLESAGTDILFLPDVSEIYPDGLSGLERFELGYLETILEGSSRPGHFQGVCQVMKRLLTIVNAHDLFMGQKDYQQCLVVSWLLSRMDLRTRLITAPTVRQADGLAMSSRNLRLSPEGRTKAAQIYKTLQFVRTSLKAGNLSSLLNTAKKMLDDKGFLVDYIQIASAADLQLQTEWDGRKPLVCLIAAFLEEVRLIDNMVITPEPNEQNK